MILLLWIVRKLDPQLLVFVRSLLKGENHLFHWTLIQRFLLTKLKGQKPELNTWMEGTITWHAANGSAAAAVGPQSGPDALGAASNKPRALATSLQKAGRTLTIAIHLSTRCSFDLSKLCRANPCKLGFNKPEVYQEAFLPEEPEELPDMFWIQVAVNKNSVLLWPYAAPPVPREAFCFWHITVNFH